MFEPFSDIVPSFFGTLNQYPMLLTFFLHAIIIAPMFVLYNIEKKKLAKGE
jgi:hypothetical protein